MEVKPFSCISCGMCCLFSRSSASQFSNNQSEIPSIYPRENVILYPEEAEILDLLASQKGISLEFDEEGIIPDIKNKRIFITRYSLEPKSDGTCPFFANNRCTVYDNRPLFCRAFPLVIKNLDEGACEYNIQTQCQSISTMKKLAKTTETGEQKLSQTFPLEIREIQKIAKREKEISLIVKRLIDEKQLDLSLTLNRDDFLDALMNWERKIIYTERSNEI